MNKLALYIFYTILIFFTIACAGEPKPSENSSAMNGKSETFTIPDFNADSALYFVKRQVEFGPRVPNTESHKACGDWLIKKLSSYSDTVYVQGARVRAFEGTTLNIRNIIGSFNPERRNRILLCAHWDTRPFADADPDPQFHYTPIDGANDGASGVGVLLEIARLLKLQKPGIGVDIMLFDAEDYGKHEEFAGQADDSWALGAQYWAGNPHVSNYFANYGILLDMVGAKNATFRHERYSMHFAPDIVRKVWNTAHRLGYSSVFINEPGGYIVDDHYYINTIARIPTINIIHYDPSQRHGFFEQWHTMGDNMDIIDKETLRAVGETVVTVIYEER